MEKPCRKTYSDYYDIIERPIGINDILRRCKSNRYDTVRQFTADWSLLFANARAYNADGSWVVVDAGVLERELRQHMENAGLSDDMSTSTDKPHHRSSSSKKKRKDSSSSKHRERDRDRDRSKKSKKRKSSSGGEKRSRRRSSSDAHDSHHHHQHRTAAAEWVGDESDGGVARGEHG